MHRKAATSAPVTSPSMISSSVPGRRRRAEERRAEERAASALDALAQRGVVGAGAIREPHGQVRGALGQPRDLAARGRARPGRRSCRAGRSRRRARPRARARTRCAAVRGGRAGAVLPRTSRSRRQRPPTRPRKSVRMFWQLAAALESSVQVSLAANCVRSGTYTTAPTALRRPPDGLPEPCTPAGSMNARTFGSSRATRSAFGCGVWHANPVSLAARGNSPQATDAMHPTQLPSTSTSTAGPVVPGVRRCESHVDAPVRADERLARVAVRGEDDRRAASRPGDERARLLRLEGKRGVRRAGRTIARYAVGRGTGLDRDAHVGEPRGTRARRAAPTRRAPTRPASRDLQRQLLDAPVGEAERRELGRVAAQRDDHVRRVGPRRKLDVGAGGVRGGACVRVVDADHIVV